MTNDTISHVSECGYIEKMLAKVDSLHNCICIEANLLDFGRTLELLLEYEKVPTIINNFDEDRADLILARFLNVQELEYRTPVFDDYRTPQFDWELGQIERIKLINEPQKLKRFGKLALLFNHAGIEWKNKRKMEIVFSGLEIE